MVVTKVAPEIAAVFEMLCANDEWFNRCMRTALEYSGDPGGAKIAEAASISTEARLRWLLQAFMQQRHAEKLEAEKLEAEKLEAEKLEAEKLKVE